MQKIGAVKSLMPEKDKKIPLSVFCSGEREKMSAVGRADNIKQQTASGDETFFLKFFFPGVASCAAASADADGGNSKSQSRVGIGRTACFAGREVKHILDRL